MRSTSQFNKIGMNKYTDIVSQFQGRWLNKIFIKGKPTDTGLKFYFICDPKFGYCLSLILHNKFQKFPYEDVHGKNFGLAWSIMSGLAIKNSKSFLHCGHVFYMDRYYTSMELLYELLNCNTYAVGKFFKTE